MTSLLQMNAVLGAWAIDVVGSPEPISSYTGTASVVRAADGTTYILKQKKHRAQIEVEASLLPRLASLGLPVAPPIVSRSGGFWTEHGRDLFCLYPCLPGESQLDHYGSGDEERARQLGRSVAEIYSALARCDASGPEAGPRITAQLERRALPTLRRRAEDLVRPSLLAVAEEALDELGELEPALPVQVLHRDLHPGNLLFLEGNLSGVIDWELVTRGPRLFDVCYCASSILLSRFRERACRARWPALFHALIDAYADRVALEQDELRARYAVLVAVELLFAAHALETGQRGTALCDLDAILWLAEERDGIGL